MRHDESAVLAWARQQGLLAPEPLGPQPMRPFPVAAMPDYGPPELGPEPPTMAPLGGGDGVAGLMAALSQFQAPPLPPPRRGEKRQGERFLYSFLSSLPQGLVASWLAQQQREGATREETNKAIARIAATNLARHRWESQRQEARIAAAREERKEQITERRHRERLGAKPTLEEEAKRTEVLAAAGARGRMAVEGPEKPPAALVSHQLALDQKRARAPYDERVARLETEQRIVLGRRESMTGRMMPADSARAIALSGQIKSLQDSALAAEQAVVSRALRRYGLNADTTAAAAQVNERARIMRELDRARERGDEAAARAVDFGSLSGDRGLAAYGAATIAAIRGARGNAR